MVTERRYRAVNGAGEIYGYFHTLREACKYVDQHPDALNVEWDNNYYVWERVHWQWGRALSGGHEQEIEVER